MDGNFLQLTEEEAEVLVCAPVRSVLKVMEILGPLVTSDKSSIRNLEVIFDSALSLEADVVRSCFYQLRKISQVSFSRSGSKLEIHTHAFISSLLDFCNSVFTCFNKSSRRCLQLAQHAATTLLTESSKYSNVTLILIQLYWLAINLQSAL